MDEITKLKKLLKKYSLEIFISWSPKKSYLLTPKITKEMSELHKIDSHFYSLFFTIYEDWKKNLGN